MARNEKRSLLSSACDSTNDCWKNPSFRDSALDIVICIITIGLLVLGIVITLLITRRRSEPKLQPTQQSAYDRAKFIFSHLFLRPADKSIAVPDSDHNPPTQMLDVTRERSRRCLTDASFVMDLSTETNILYSGNTLKEHVIAQKDHLEYDFGSSSELESLAKQYLQSRRSFLPPILECTSRCDSFDNLSLLLSPKELARRQQVQRKFVLFSGSEEKHRWLPSTGNNLDFMDDRLWTFTERSSSLDELGSED